MSGQGGKIGMLYIMLMFHIFSKKCGQYFFNVHFIDVGCFRSFYALLGLLVNVLGTKGLRTPLIVSC